MRRPKKNKYGNRKCEYEGRKFDSQKEMYRYIELRKMEDEGLIKFLECQKSYELQPAFSHNGIRYRAITYVADFCYYSEDGEYIIEDVKSEATRKDKVYRLKKKMMAYKGLIISEV